MSKSELEDKTRRVFCDKEILELIDDSSLYSNNELSRQVNPASIDTTISDIAWEVPAALSFRNNESMETLDDYFKKLSPNNEGYFILEPKKHYIFLLNERIDLDLHPEVGTKANPKSSTGRVDLYVRLVSDAKNNFNSLEKGYRGKIGLLMESKTFRIGIKPGASLNQLRFQIGNPLIKRKELHKRYLKDELLLDKNGEVIEKYKVNFGEGLLLSLNLTTPIYKAKKEFKK
ncbi:2'-deoxycytidine 5'-triphosphate deaminase [Candidatus Woesearchaeota archaeon]|nr:2'-deoxycytidine 5'-triphosphate deaminase [Candidatus Woesearchaeota archaeon]